MEKKDKRIGLIDWILAKPEGEKFLVALLLTVISLVTCVLVMEVRYERNMGKLNDCKEEKVEMQKANDSQFLEYIIQNNTKSERKNEIIDSLNTELLKLIRK